MIYEKNTDNLNILNQQRLLTPEAIKQHLPLTQAAHDTVLQGRRNLQAILDQQDPRLFIVVGPCSVHDTDAAIEYARRLKTLADEVQDSMILIMRVYFEKPRTTTGWKGLINDPFLDDSFQIEEGLQQARRLLLTIAELGLPTATEALDPISVQYLSDLIAWYAIGARTTESQTHREMASGLSAPVGFKNGTDGSLDVAINALLSVSSEHSFLGIDPQGYCAITRTRGNPYGHVVLRGGGGKPNYDSVTIKLCEQSLTAKGLLTNIMVDCSHANSNKDPALQTLVLQDCVNQIVEGNRSIIGMMLESNLGWGNQTVPDDRSQLQYGVSITDACIDWETTERALRDAHTPLQPVIQARRQANKQSI